MHPACFRDPVSASSSYPPKAVVRCTPGVRVRKGSSPLSTEVRACGRALAIARRSYHNITGCRRWKLSSNLNLGEGEGVSGPTSHLQLFSLDWTALALEVTCAPRETHELRLLLESPVSARITTHPTTATAAFRTDVGSVGNEAHQAGTREHVSRYQGWEVSCAWAATPSRSVGRWAHGPVFKRLLGHSGRRAQSGVPEKKGPYSGGDIRKRVGGKDQVVVMICSRSTVRKKRTRGAVSRITNNKSDAKNQHFGTDVNAASECVVSERASETDYVATTERQTKRRE